MPLIIGIVGVILLLVCYVIGVYNKLVNARNKVENQFSQVDIQLKRRADLIPNLVETVKGYAKHEEGTFTKIVEARNAYMDSMSLKDATNANTELNRLIALAESYPELKASEQYLNLQKQLVKCENQLQAARRVYNSEVEVYNNAIMVFPANMLASVFGYKQEKYFELENAEEAKNIEVKL